MKNQADIISKSCRYCICEGHLTDDKEKRSIYTHQFPGETFIPKCVLTRNRYNQRPTINNELFAYKLTATPSIVRANYKRTTIIDKENNNKEFSFNGFIILAHSPINVLFSLSSFSFFFLFFLISANIVLLQSQLKFSMIFRFLLDASTPDNTYGNITHIKT
jgi:hypothetical protein